MTFVQFADASETTIVSVFAGPQDPAAYPNQGTVEDDDARLVAFLNPPPLILPIYKRQLLDWLWLNKGKTAADVDAAITAIQDANVRQLASNAWNFPDGGMIHRDNPLVDQLGTAFGMTPADIDAAFAEAGGL